MNELFALPREWMSATGEIGRFTGEIVRDVWGLRVFRFFGEALRQCGILIVGSEMCIRDRCGACACSASSARPCARRAS